MPPAGSRRRSTRDDHHATLAYFPRIGSGTELAWWQRGAIYQIDPRSFADRDGDSVGDVRGVLGRLDHLVALGVSALWLSPFYRSPMADFGYDS